MQALYAAEAVEVAAGTAEVSRAQRDRAEQMWQAGSISKVDFAPSSKASMRATSTK